MSDFWKHNITAKNKLRVQMQVWAVYEDCQYFQYSKDWVLRSLYCANEKVADMIVKQYNKIELEENPDTPRGQLTGDLDIGDTFLYTLIQRIISEIAILKIENVPALPEFWEHAFHSDDNLAILPTAIYEITFTNKDFADSFVIDEKWDSPCFDIKDENEVGIEKEKLSFGINPKY